MDILKEFMPYIAAVITSTISGVCSYLKSKRDFKNKVETIEMNNKYEIEKLMEQHKVDIENLKEKHKLEMEAKDKEHEHEKEILELKSQNAINEHGQEVMNNAMAGVVGDVFSGMLSGKIKPEDIEKFSKKFPNKKQ